MAVQNTYLDNLPEGFAGMIANLEPNTLISRILQTSAGIGFGQPVAQGTKDGQCKVVSSSSKAVIGITVRDQSATDDTVKQYESVLLIRNGVIWVEVAAAVVAGADVWVEVSDGGFRSTDAGSDGGIKLGGCRWETSAAEDGLAVMRVNLDVPFTSGAS